MFSMDNTVAVALITALAGIAGAATTAVISSVTAARLDRRTETRDGIKWRRELAEKDRERLYELFEQIVAMQRETLVAMSDLLEQSAPQTRAEQAPAKAAANQLVLLSARASILGATGVSSAPLALLVQETTDSLRSAPIPDSAREAFFEQFNREAASARRRMAESMRELRSEK